MRRNVRFLFPEGKPRALTLSYDDGNVADRRLAGILNKHKIKGSFHLNAGTLGKNNVIAPEEIAELFQGHEISCHSFTHPFLERISRTEVVREMLEDRLELEKLAGYPVRGMSYPFGTYSQEVIEVLKSLDIVYARTVQSTGKFVLPENFLEWHPTCHHKDNLLERTAQFKKTPYSFSLFYVWGHSYEFDRENNWGLIEDFCAEIAGDETIWYATNIEIYDYSAALKRLEFSADSSLVKNPNSMPVWLSVNGSPVKVLPGELKTLNIPEPA
ncbi:MAG: polysaccharide deacetylase family protein [Victivallaceae bacterium]|jgi:peptidoglycan/xylan/chitin deacetylase (PgdA/CDA1 family)